MVRGVKARTTQLLRWSEQYTKTDMTYLASGGFWTMTMQAMTIVCSVPLSIALANFLTPHEYGMYRYVLTVAAIIGAFSLTGLPMALMRAAARDYPGSLKAAFILNLRWSFLVVLGATAGALYYGVRENYVLAGAMVLIAVFSPLLSAGNLFPAYLNGKRLFSINAWYSNQRTLIHTVVIIATAFFFPDPLSVLLAYFGVQTLTALYFYRKTIRRLALHGATDPEMESNGKHMSLLNIFNVLTDKLDALLLFQFVGAVELALYSFAEMVPDLFNRFNKNIAQLAFPKFALRTDPKGIWLKTALISFALLPAVGLYCAWAPYIFELFFPAYMDAVPFTQALAVLTLINVTLPSAYIDAQGAIRGKYIITIINGTIKIIAIGGGIILFGIWGAVAGRFISRVLGTGVTAIVLKKLY